MIGQTISHYKILGKIAEGGMGIVYKAEDTTLKRCIALKFPSAHILEDERKKTRFIHEARAAAALDHPNICMLHEIGEAEGKTFISMAYVEGQTLYEKIKSGPLSVPEAVDISIQAAQGLYEAHEKGIVHRDVKSANIMVTHNGQVKIMDFGLAKIAGQTSLTLTRQGAVMGTAAYMSPEQAGGKPVDYRTDIWSLGVVMYEMLTGELPFKGPNAQAVIHAILHNEPPYPRSLRKDVPLTLEETVLQMMQKEPLNRHENLGALIGELQSITRDSITSLAACEKSPSLAVLSFTNMSPDKNQEYFCDGMAEELINALTQIRDLRVIARTSAFSYKGRDVNVRDIGRELNVKTILEGSVRKAGNRLRITAQLVDTTHGHHLWSERYDRDMGDVFAIQDEITSVIVDKLRPKLLGEEKARLVGRQDVDIEVYHLYLKGLYFRNKLTEADLRKAIEYFEHAIERDPNYALAYAGLAQSYIMLPIASSLPPKEVFPKAREAALKALQIDDTLPEAHAALGLIKINYDWDWAGGESHCKRAIELDPGYALAYDWYSCTFLFRARFDEALKEVEKALELDPVSILINLDFGQICYYAGLLDRAIDAAKKALEMDPSIIWAHFSLGGVYLAKSMYEEALLEFKKEKEISRGAHAWAETFIGLTYAQMGNLDEAQKVLGNLLERSKQKYFSPVISAILYFLLGRNDEGFKLLNQAYDQHDRWLCWLKIHPILDSVRSDPRYTALLKKMNLE